MSLNPAPSRTTRTTGYGRLLPPALVLFFLLLNVLFLRIAMLGQFDPYDYGAFMDMAWRVLCGQKPYVDFITHCQPVFFYTLAFFFKLFGYGKTGAFMHLLFTSSAAIIAVYRMVRKRIPLYATALVLTLTTVGFHWNYPFPNYNHDALLWGLVAVALMASQIPFSHAKRAFWTGAACGFFGAIAVMTKINIGGPYCAVLLFTLLCGNRKTASLSGFAAGMLSGLALTFPLAGDLREFISQNYIYAAKQKSRMGLLLVPSKWLVNGFWIVVTLVLVHVRELVYRLGQRTALFIGLVAVAFLHYHTSSISVAAHIPLLGAIVGLAWIEIDEANRLRGPAGSPGIRRMTVPLLVLFVLFHILQSSRYSTQIAFGRHPNPDIHDEYVIKTRPFAGWQAPLVWGQALDEVPVYLDANVPRNETLLIIGPLQPVYPMTGRESFKGLTYDFKFRDMPAPGAHVARVRDAILSHPPDWVLTYRDAGPFPLNIMINYLGLEDYLLAHYKAVKDWGVVGLMKRVS